MELRDKVRETIKKYNLLEKGDRVMMGVSGGPDSVTLAYILTSLQSEFGLSLFIAHLNHMIRPVEAEKDVRFVRELSNRLGIPLFIKHENIPDFIKEKKVSPEAGAREVRYAFFKETAEKNSINKIALGHTMGDQAETLLLNLLRGSGNTGLGAILPRNGNYIRPLIECSKEELLKFLEENKLTFCVDSTNLQTVYERNKIRLELIPYLAKEYNPNIRETLFRTSMIIQQEDAYLESQAQRHVGHILKNGRHEEVMLNIREFEKLAPAIKPRILREAVRRAKGNILQLSYVHITDLLVLVEAKPSGSSLDLPDGLYARKEYSRLIFAKGRRPPPASSAPVERHTSHDQSRGGQEQEKREEKGRENEKLGYILRKVVFDRNKPFNFYRATHDTAFLNADKISATLSVRMREDGDRFFPQGAKGHKKLSDFLIDRKVPRDMRERIPLLVSGNDILWVVGYRISEEFKITQETKKVMKVTIFRKA
ncbi:tRNA lysidine(34) synthetase TilS [Candidatus Desantisbacteria bacterium CG_4_10_14_0_8_um_filter_48_22]|uniref:tRNA(Ile)-lysidine synthase n=1 Tax=Candidatus Desantisbacteria bacterium CG_4_10_14_0_8_um_filter_48_22 TaxID=1974543 RepID=A0A2M7SFB1_9BACT|nr:MAG: tRNA lysidine(34) synthetase TilS [Candidatus Desantisbacteria bacterium CG1_02_49_89]PIZ18235.1 MAG: tRNA lysidine(34) synthetase TilS [Candidatus Desantisbacteria bacterium CG_4_10_14_0_8_um_filter_48_22]